MSVADVLAGRRQWYVQCCDVLDGLRAMPAESVNCVVTSVPYFGLRDYGTGRWEGGDPSCEHKKVPDGVKAVATSTLDGGKKTTGHQQEGYRGECGRCGAVRVDKQIGLEATLDEYLAKMVAVFAEVRRVMRRDATLWLNIGDSYNNRSVARKSSHQGGLGFESDDLSKSWADLTKEGRTRLSRTDNGLKEKDLLGVPWALAFALRADGWYLRSAITWCKKAAMPESVRDRPTSATEMVFLLAKAPRYWYDSEAVREPNTDGTLARHANAPVTRYAEHDPVGTVPPGHPTERHPDKHQNGLNVNGASPINTSGRNLRNYWLLGPEPLDEPHYAAFPTEIPRRAILAGCPPKVCPACGAPWRRVTERESTAESPRGSRPSDFRANLKPPQQSNVSVRVVTLGWEPTCDCQDCPNRKDGRHLWLEGTDICGACGVGWEDRMPDPIGGVVLDPFAGRGTTVIVALRHGRRAVGLELSPTYAVLARTQIVCDSPMFNGVTEAGG